MNTKLNLISVTIALFISINYDYVLLWFIRVLFCSIIINYDLTSRLNVDIS